MSSLQKYLDSAVSVLEQYNIVPSKDEESQMAGLLQDVVKVDEPKVLAIARTLQYAGTFNQLVRDNVKDVRVGERYQTITEMFDSIREDSKKMLKQLEDGKVDLKERVENMWMKLLRGTPHARFEKIRGTYLEVSKDTKKHLDTENTILEAYINFRFAFKDAEILSYEVLKVQEETLERAKGVYTEAVEKVTNYKGEDRAERSTLEKTRDEAQHKLQEEDRKYQLIKDVAENLALGYNVGETLVAKLKQTHDVKEQVYRKAVTFFQTNEHVFTTMDAVYTSQHGLHEATQTLESMRKGMNKGLEDIAELGNKLERAAIQAGYGSTYNPESVKKLIDSIVSFQEESLSDIRRLRTESTENVKIVGQIVDEGKQRYKAAFEKFYSGQQKELPEKTK